MVPRARARKIINLLQQKPKINISGFLFVREELKCDIKLFCTAMKFLGATRKQKVHKASRERARFSTSSPRFESPRNCLVSEEGNT